MVRNRKNAGATRSFFFHRFVSILLIAFLLGPSIAAVPAGAEEPGAAPAGIEEKIRELEQSLKGLAGQVGELKKADASRASSWTERFTLGGYGEIHGNFGEGDAADQLDIHRLVAYVGYTFSDWIRLHSETELEHAFVSRESDGELSIEQLYLEFLLSPYVNVRIGRILTPLGIINKKHEPPTFYGVERPSFDRVIIPTTWSSDGAGIFGSILPSLKYEVYGVGGLDGSDFNALNGIRGGRIKERPSLHDPAVTGRLDFFPFAGSSLGSGQYLRVGASAYYGGIDNGNEGENPGIDGDLLILSGDFEYTVSRFDFRGVIAHEQIDGAREIGNGAASEIFGWYLEAAYRFWPDAWKRGKLSRSDAGVFARYEEFDTQLETPDGIPENPAGDRTELTVGFNFYITPTLVAKVDYQIRDDGTGKDLPELFNLGIGWQF